MLLICWRPRYSPLESGNGTSIWSTSSSLRKLYVWFSRFANTFSTWTSAYLRLPVACLVRFTYGVVSKYGRLIVSLSACCVAPDCSSILPYDALAAEGSKVFPCRLYSCDGYYQQHSDVNCSWKAIKPRTLSTLCLQPRLLPCSFAEPSLTWSSLTYTRYQKCSQKHSLHSSFFYPRSLSSLLCSLCLSRKQSLMVQRASSWHDVPLLLHLTSSCIAMHGCRVRMDHLLLPRSTYVSI